MSILIAVRGGYRGRPGIDWGEFISVAVLAIIGLWGAWFGVQSLITLWWPVNVAYLSAGAAVAVISAFVAKAVLNR